MPVLVVMVQEIQTNGCHYRIAPVGTKLSIPQFDLDTIDGQLTALQSPTPNVRELGRARLVKAGGKSISPVRKLLDHKNPFIQARAISSGQTGKKWSTGSRRTP